MNITKNSLIVILILSIIISCKKEKTKETKAPVEVNPVNTVMDIDKVEKTGDEHLEMMNTLKKLKPIEKEQIEKVLNKKHDNFVCKNFQYVNQDKLGAVTFIANYSEGSNKHIKIEGMDGAGELGAAMISKVYQHINMENVESSTFCNFKASKPIINDGQKSIEIDFLVNKRFMYKLLGRNMTLEELSSFVKKLNLKSLH